MNSIIVNKILIEVLVEVKQKLNSEDIIRDKMCVSLSAAHLPRYACIQQLDRQAT